MKSMFSAIYIEEEVKDTERVRKMLARFPSVPQIICERYTEIFNRKGQNFRLQKKAPSLILAKKYGKLAIPAPAGYGFESGESYYFSHMLNCLYDCRYCFLQGMYRSANYVLFTNYEDFGRQLSNAISSTTEPLVFYSGYDCDSLALEPVSEFCKYFIPLFSGHSHAALEIRTKSTQIRHLLEMNPIANCIIAMSFTSEEATKLWEHKVPSIEKRLDALVRLQKAGWKVALRFEPLIENENIQQQYLQLFERIFTRLDCEAIHSVSLGMFRMPVDFHKNIVKLYPDEPLFARTTKVEDGMISLKSEGEQESLRALEEMLFTYITAQQYYRCA